MSYKIGDMVRIRKDIEEIESEDKLYFAPEMREYLGRTFPVMSVEESSEGYARYKLQSCVDHTDNYPWMWAEEWLEPYDECPYCEVDDETLTDLFK